MAPSAASSLIMNLPQMIDLAVNAPELGVVNFRILGALLHVLVQQLNLTSCNVEYRGKDSDQIQSLLAVAQSSTPIALTEYVVSPDDLAKGVDAGRKKSISPEAKKTRQSKEELVEETTIVLVEPKISDRGPHVSVAISKAYFDKMQSDLGTLQEKVNEIMDLPGNLGILDAARNPEASSTPILNMFNMMTQSKRIDGVESGLEKMASLLEDMARSASRGHRTHASSSARIRAHESKHRASEKTREKSSRPSEAKADKSARNKTDDDATAEGGDAEGRTEVEGEFTEGDTTEGGISSPKKDPSGELSRAPSNTESFRKQKSYQGSLKSLGSLLELEDRVAILEGRVDQMASIKKSVTSLGSAIPTTGSSSQTKGADDDIILKLRQKVKELGDKVGGLSEITKHFPPQEIVQLLMDVKRKRRTQSSKDLLATTTPTTTAPITTTAEEDSEEMSVPNVVETRLGELEVRIDERSKEMFNLNTTINNQLTLLQAQFIDLEKDMASLLERMNTVLPTGDPSSSERGIADIYNKLQEQQTDIELLAEHAHRLAEEKEERQQHMDALIEQVEVLKTIKADREDLEDALADKADACAINRKVSHDQFNTACDELSRGIEETLCKLTEQESLWQAALDDIQHEIGNKLDKMELSPLRDFINHKLKHLQDRLKALAALKKETEAAGSKSKYLRNVNCISCDKDVVMRKEMDPNLYPPAPAMHATKNIGPYLAYELDALRKQQKMIPGARNLNHFENATGARKAKGQDHLCNRYCGGSHTVTTPQQRVTRLGNFLQQWGPEVMPVGEGTIKGADGHLYKGDEQPTKEAEDLIRQSLVVQGVSTPRQSQVSGAVKASSKVSVVASEVPEKDTPRDRAESKISKAREPSHQSVARSQRGQSAGSVRRTSSGRQPSVAHSARASKTSQASATKAKEAAAASETPGEGGAPAAAPAPGEEEAAPIIAEGEALPASGSRASSVAKVASQTGSVARGSKAPSKLSVVQEVPAEMEEPVTTEGVTVEETVEVVQTTEETVSVGNVEVAEPVQEEVAAAPAPAPEEAEEPPPAE